MAVLVTVPVSRKCHKARNQWAREVTQHLNSTPIHGTVFVTKQIVRPQSSCLKYEVDIGLHITPSSQATQNKGIAETEHVDHCLWRKTRTHVKEKQDARISQTSRSHAIPTNDGVACRIAVV